MKNIIMTNIRKEVCLIANALMKAGMPSSPAFKKAWKMVKGVTVKTNVAGVTFDNRQRLLGRLEKYKGSEIYIVLERDKNNPYDVNAVKVVAGVIGKGSACVGFLPKDLALMIAPILDKGIDLRVELKGIVGGWDKGVNYGMNIELDMVA